MAYLLEQHGIVMPRRLQMEFSSLVQQEADGSGQEISGEMILACFTRHYLEQGKPYALRAPKLVSEGDVTYLEATLEQGMQRIDLSGEATARWRHWSMRLPSVAFILISPITTNMPPVTVPRLRRWPMWKFAWATSCCSAPLAMAVACSLPSKRSPVRSIAHRAWGCSAW